MKKLLLILAVFIVFTFTGCGEDLSMTKPTEPDTLTLSQYFKFNKRRIAYYVVEENGETTINEVFIFEKGAINCYDDMYLSPYDIEAMTDDEMEEYCKAHGNNKGKYINFRFLSHFTLPERERYSTYYRRSKDFVSEEIQVKDAEGNYVTLNNFVITSISPVTARFILKLGRSFSAHLTQLHLDGRGYLILEDAPDLTFDEIESNNVKFEIEYVD